MNEAGVGVGVGYFQCMNFSKKPSNQIYNKF